MAFALDTESFLSAFYHMVNRREKPVKLHPIMVGILLQLAHKIMLKAAKRALKAVLTNTDVSDEELMTAIILQ